MEVEKGHAEIGGGKFYYELAGDGPAVAFIHGNTLDCTMWDQQFAEFAKYFQVLRYDMRGFGRSATPPSGPYSHSDDLAALLGRLGIKSAHIIGLSMGGRVAINFAVSHPDKTESLITVDAGLDGYELQDGPPAVPAIIEARRTGLEEARAVWLSHPLFASALEKPELAQHVRKMVAGYTGWHWLNADPQVNPSPQAIRRLCDIKVPAFIIVGEKDLRDFKGTADLLAKEIERARKLVISGVSHLASMEAPELFNREVIKFILNAEEERITKDE